MRLRGGESHPLLDVFISCPHHPHRDVFEWRWWGSGDTEAGSSRVQPPARRGLEPAHPHSRCFIQRCQL